jgi:hypothetical protein
MCTLPLPLSSGEAPNCTATEVEQFDPNLPLQPPSVTVKVRMLSLHTWSSSRKLQLMLCSIGIIVSFLTIAWEAQMLAIGDSICKII